MKKRIILIEDNQDACTLFKHILFNAGYDVRDFRDGKYLLDNHSDAPDLYIFDNSLPNIDGVALTKYLKIQNDTRNVPVLIMSGNAAVSLKTKKCGASGFIAKPFEVNNFLHVVHNMIQDPSYCYFENTEDLIVPHPGKKSEKPLDVLKDERQQ